MSAFHFVNVTTWFTDHIHEGYDKIPYRGRTGPSRKVWWEEFQKWPATAQLKIVNDFAQFYNNIYDSKKLDTAKRIIARMAELFELVPSLRERMFHKQLLGFKDEIKVYEHLVDNVERLFREEGLPEPDLVRRLVDRMAVLVRPKLFWKLMDLKKRDQTAISELKDQWEIFVSAKMSKHEFKEFFLWMFNMIGWSPNGTPHSRAKICQIARDVVSHSFSGPRTGVRLLPVRALSNNSEVLHRFCALIGADLGSMPALKGNKARENLEAFMEKLVLKEMREGLTGNQPNTMDVDSVSSRADDKDSAMFAKLDRCFGFPDNPEPVRFFSDTNSSAGRSSVPPSLPPEEPPRVMEQIQERRSMTPRSRPASRLDSHDISFEPPRKRFRSIPRFLGNRQQQMCNPAPRTPNVSNQPSWGQNLPPAQFAVSPSVRGPPQAVPAPSMPPLEQSGGVTRPNQPAQLPPSSALGSLSGRRIPLRMTLDKFEMWIRRLQEQQQKMELHLTNRIRQQIMIQEQQIRQRQDQNFEMMQPQNAPSQWTQSEVSWAQETAVSNPITERFPMAGNTQGQTDEIPFFEYAPPPAPQLQHPGVPPQHAQQQELSYSVPPPVCYEPPKTHVRQNTYPQGPAQGQAPQLPLFGFEAPNSAPNSMPPNPSQMGNIYSAAAFTPNYGMESNNLAMGPWMADGHVNNATHGRLGMDLDVPSDVFANQPLQPPLETDYSQYQNSCWDSFNNGAGSFAYQ